ncbi:MAG: peptidylprolyl isomerase [bacterium]
MKKIVLGILSMFLVLMVGCSKENPIVPKDESPVIIKVNKKDITQNMFDKTFKGIYNSSFLAQKNIDINMPQNRVIYLIYKDKTINELVVRELIDQEAKKRNITVSEDEINKTVDETAQKLGGKDKLEATLTLNNIDKQEFLNNIRLDLINKKLVKSLVSETKISDNEIKEFYEKAKAEKFTHPEQVRAQHIFINASESNIKEKIEAENPSLSKDEGNKKVQEEINKAKAKAEQILAKVKANPASFGDLAKKNSEDASTAEKGGDLGFFSKEEMVPQFSKVAFSITPGQISDIVKSDFGFHIIKVNDRKRAGITPLVEVKKEIEQYIREQKKMQALQKLLESTKNNTEITYLNKEYNPENIENEIKKLVQQKQAQLPKENLKNNTQKAEKK